MENLLLSYAEDLNDNYPGHEFSIWSREQLLGYLNDALCLIVAHRPDLFTELKIVKVDPCTNYLESCDCTNIIEVLGQCDISGRIIRTLPRREKSTTTWTGKPKNPNGYKFTTDLTEYELIDGANIVRVFPQNLDPDTPIYILIRCSVEAKTYTLDDEVPDMRCAYLAAARHWVLYNAKMIDAELSPNMRDAAREHREMFTSIIQLVKKADDDYNTETTNKRG